MPVEQYDVVIIDSFGGVTPGISEAEGAKLQQAMDTLKSLADRGPAVMVLDNTTKNATNYRGRGEKLDRVDIAYEARDVTGWTPTGPEWWIDLPDAAASNWQEQASRHQKADKRRLAFIPIKFRFGIEPEPFICEIDFTTKPWSLQDVTETIKEQGDSAYKEERLNHAAKQFAAVEALVVEVRRRDEEGMPAIGKREAEHFMYDLGGLTQHEACRLLVSHDANTYPSEGRWRIEAIPGREAIKKPCPLS